MNKRGSMEIMRMNMIKFYRSRNHIIAGLILPLLFLLIDMPAFGGGGVSEEIRVEKINPTLEKDAVIIAYDLIAPPDKKYEVSLVLRRENDRTFSFVPKTVSGDVGKGTFTGQNREIRWEFKQDAPQGFKGDDYYIEITVKKAGGSKIWLYGALGAVAVGAGIAGSVIIDPPPPPSKELPVPPDRPPR